MELKKQHIHARRFERAVYEAADRQELDAAPLLAALESARTLASGVVSILTVVRSHGLPEGEDHEDSRAVIDNLQTDDMISLCIESMGMLYTQIEHLADQLSLKHATK